jgi:aspartokinase
VALSCAALGLSTVLISISALGISARGDPLASVPHIADPWPVTQALRHHDIVIVPGFGARCADTNRHVLLGRGGSDLTAAVIAGALKLKSIRLIKDVGGHYSGDPKQAGATRIARAGWSEARLIAGRLVQREALDWAGRLGIAIEVAGLGSDEPSVIGPAE